MINGEEPRHLLQLWKLSDFLHVSQLQAASMLEDLEFPLSLAVNPRMMGGTIPVRIPIRNRPLFNLFIE